MYGVGDGNGRGHGGAFGRFSLIKSSVASQIAFFKLIHQPWSLTDYGTGGCWGVAQVCGTPVGTSQDGYQVEVLRTHNRGGIL